MRLFLAVFSTLTLFFLATSAMAQSADIQWKDLSAGERQGILNQWRALPQAEKGPFIAYRTQAIKNLSEEKKAQYSDVAKARAKKEQALHADYKKRQAVEKKEQAKIEKARATAIEAPAPIINEISQPDAIAPGASIEMDKAAPVAPAVETKPTDKATDESASEKAQKMIDKFF